MKNSGHYRRGLQTTNIWRVKFSTGNALSIIPEVFVTSECLYDRVETALVDKANDGARVYYCPDVSLLVSLNGVGS